MRYANKLHEYLWLKYNEELLLLFFTESKEYTASVR